MANTMTWYRGPAVILLTIGLSSAAVAQTSRPAAGADSGASERTGDAPAAGLLAGPRVESEALVERDRAFGRESNRKGRAAIQPRQWLALARGLDLTLEQEDAVRRILKELDRDRRAFQRKHGAELRALRRTANRRRRDDGGEVRDTGDATGTDDVTPSPRELGRKLQEIQALAPKVETYQQRVWDELTAAQQDRFRVDLARLRAEMAARRKSKPGMTDGKEPSERDAKKPRRPGDDASP